MDDNLAIGGGRTLCEIAAFFKMNLENLREQASRIEDEKAALVPPVFETQRQVLQLHDFCQKQELYFYHTLGVMIYQLQMRYRTLFSSLGENESAKYASLKSIVEQFGLIAKWCEQTQMQIMEQIRALESMRVLLTPNQQIATRQNNEPLEKFLLAWMAQQQIMVDVEKYSLAQTQTFPRQGTPSLLKSVKPNENVVQLRLFRGFARAAAMIILAITLFVESIQPTLGAPQRFSYDSQNQTSLLHNQSLPHETQQTFEFNVPGITHAISQTVHAAVDTIVTVSECLDFTKYWEGFRPSSYKDSEGYLTIGYGTCIDTKVRRDAPNHVARVGLDFQKVVSGQQQVSKDVAVRLMLPDMTQAYNFAPQVVKTFSRLDKYAQLTVVDMIYTMGENKFVGFKEMITALNKMDYSAAAAEMKNSKWFKQTGKRAQHHFEVMHALAMGKTSAQDRIAT